MGVVRQSDPTNYPHSGNMANIPIIHRTVRSVFRFLPIRGRHRFIEAFAPLFSGGSEVVRVGRLNVEIDHTLSHSRYMYYGLYEPHLTNWIHANIHEGDAVIEPGANVGFIMGHLLGQVGESGKLIALEPSRICTDQLNRNNDLASIPGLVFLNAAIANASRELTYYETPRIISQGFGCLAEVGQPAGTPYTVKAFSVDDLLHQHEIQKLRFLKLDIEGSELIALEGASVALAEGRIDNVMVETTYSPGDPESLSHNRSIATVLSDAGFKPHRMLRNGTVRAMKSDMLGPKGFRTDVMWSRC